MHRSLELLLVWKSQILLCARDWTLLGSFAWASCTCVIQLLAVHLKEAQDVQEELVCVYPSLVHPYRFRIRFVAHAQTALHKHAYFGNPCQTVLVIYIPFPDGVIFHQDQ